MRNPSFAVLVAMCLSAVATAGKTTQPLTPVDQIPVPGPRAPVAAVNPAPPVEIAPAGSKVVIVPFESLGNADRRDWVVRALQESFSTEAARLGGLFVFSAPAPADQKIDTAAARDIARTYSGDLVILGSCQFAETGVRITGQIINVKTGESVAGLKASGDMRDLFSLEDQLTGQMSRALRPPKTQLAQAQPNLILTQPAPQLTADDLYPAPNYSYGSADAYNRYYYQPYGAYSFYNGFGGYTYPGFFGNTYFPATFGFYPNRFHPGGEFHHRRDADVGSHPYQGTY